MTRERFENFMKRNNQRPFQIVLNNQQILKPLILDAVYEDGIDAMLNGELVVLSYTDITSCAPVQSVPVQAPAPEVSRQDCWEEELQKAEKLIQLQKAELIDRRETIKKNLKGSPVLKEWSKIDSSFRDAVKSHVLSVRRNDLVGALDTLYETYPYPEIKQQLAAIFCELGQWDDASCEYEYAHDFYNAFVCNLKNEEIAHARDNLLQFIINQKNYENSVLLSAMFLLYQTKKGAQCADMVRKTEISALSDTEAETVYYGLILLISLYGRIKLPDCSHREQIPVLLDSLTSFSSGEKIKEMEVPESAFPQSPAEIPQPEKKEKVSFPVYNGYIVKYQNKELYSFGFIRPENNNQTLYFSIEQVEDEQLQKMLYHCEYEDIKKIKVTYTIAQGKKGKVADHIKAVDDISKMYQIHEGFIDAFGKYDSYGNRYGEIISEGKTYMFRQTAVIDPHLSAYIDQSFSARNVYVKFTFRKLGQNRIVLKLWFDEEQEQQHIIEYDSFVSKQEYDRFLNERYSIENFFSSTSPLDYESLVPWQDEEEELSQKDISAPKTENFSHSVIFKNEYDGKKQPVHLNGIDEMRKKIQRLMTEEKNLNKAEILCQEVLSRYPNDSMVAATLLNIYLATNRIETGLSYISKYETALGKEKADNFRIQYLDKAKDFDKLIPLLEKVIYKEAKPSTKADRANKLILCYIKSGKVPAALKQLEKYKRYLNEQQYNNLYISCLEALGNFEELEKYLSEKLIPTTYRADFKLNYINRLALIYKNDKKYSEAIYWFEQWKKTVASSRSYIASSTFGAQIPKLEITVDRNLSVLYFISGKEEKAKEYARDLIRKNSEDTIAQQILRGNYNILQEENETTDYKENNVDSSGTYNNNDSGIDEYEFPKYVDYLMNQVDFNSNIAYKNLLGNIKDGKYTADIHQAEKDISIQERGVGNMTSESKSACMLALAKIVQQFLEDNQNSQSINISRLKGFIGKSLSFLGDANIQLNRNLDTSRYCYMLSIGTENFSSSEKRFHASVNMLYSTFFLSENELSERITGKDEIESKINYEISHYNEEVVAVKDLLLCSFMLLDSNPNSQDIPDIVRRIIDRIYSDKKLKKRADDYFIQILQNSLEPDSNFTEFNRKHKSACEKYKEISDKINEHICYITNKEQITIAERISESIQYLNQSHLRNFLFDTDYDRLISIKNILTRWKRLSELKDVDDSISELHNILDECDNLLAKIQKSPTKFSYEFWLDSIINMMEFAKSELDTLYKNSIPKLEVSTCSVAYYENDSDSCQTQVTIYIETKDSNVQKADISNIQIQGYENNVEIIGNPVHSITTVKGGSKEEYIINLRFTEAEKERRNFDIVFRFDYSFYNGINEPVTKSFEDTFPINLLTKDEFSQIDNPFDRYSTGGTVVDNDMFYGRTKEIEDILNMLDQGNGKVLVHQGIYMYGQTRTGKSTIMHHLKEGIENRYPNSYLIVDLGMLTIPPSEDMKTYLEVLIIGGIERSLRNNSHDLYKKISESVNFREIIKSISSNSNPATFEIAMHDISDFMGDKVFMIFADEFTNIYGGIHRGLVDKKFPSFWKALLQNYNTCSIVIGKDNMFQFANDAHYRNDFACMKDYRVSYLKEESARQLISNPILDCGKTRFEEEALVRIYELTAGSAFLIMVLCKYLVEYMNSTCTSRVTKVTVETFLNKYLFEPSVISAELTDLHFDAQFTDPCFYEEENSAVRNDFFNKNTENVSSDNKIILSFIANHCNQNFQIKKEEIDCTTLLSIQDKEYQDRLISQLIERKVLLEDGDYCKIWIDLLRLYLKKGLK